MLFNIKHNQKTKFKIPAASIGAASRFNPLLLPGYFAGYLMNYTTDVPAGTINPVLASRDWWSTLSTVTKKFNKGENTTTALVNGFKAASFTTGVNSRYTNTTTDLLTGITDFSFLVGFKRADPNPNNAFLLTFKNNPDTIFLFIYFISGGLMRVEFGGGAQYCRCNPGVTVYADNTWHALVVKVDQTNKTLSIKTDTGETLSNTNLLISTGVMTPSNSLDAQLGVYGVTPTTSPYAVGYMGDLLLFNRVISTGETDALLGWESNRLGI